MFVSLRMGADLHAEIAQLAQRNDRSTSAEIRLAVREHVDAQREAA